jgi:type IV pilus assembly protein PilX
VIRMHTSSFSERGMALVSSLLLLLVLTMLGVGMFRSFGLQERIAGNTRERQRALHAAIVGQSYAEWWLRVNNGANAGQGNTCAAGVVTTVSLPGTPPLICTNALASPEQVPWGTGTYNAYTPNGMPIAAAGTIDAYQKEPRFYIQFISGFYDKATNTQTNNYLIDSHGTAGSTNTVAVVEDAFSVNVTYTAETNNTTNVNDGLQ